MDVHCKILKWTSGKFCFEGCYQNQIQTDIGSDVFSDNVDISVSFFLSNTCTIFPAEAYEINLAAWKIVQFSPDALAIGIYIDNLAQGIEF